MLDKSLCIGVVDTGTSNIKSVVYALGQYVSNIIIISKYENVNRFDGIVVPGVGSFNHVMNNLHKTKLDDFIKDFIETSKPMFFICVGLQILFEKSDEFIESKGLHLLDGTVKKIPCDNKKRSVPMIGWNNINLKKNSKYFKNIPSSTQFYFIHSYYVDLKNKSFLHSEANYKSFTYCSSIEFNNIFATQFHPEKSGIEGLKIYSNFIDVCDEEKNS